MPGIVLAEGVVEVSADAKGVPRDIQRDIQAGEGQAKTAGEGIGKSIFGGIIGAVATLGIADKIFGFIGGSITGASDLNETLSKSSVIFGSNATAIEQWGSTAYKTVGLSKSAAVAAAASFGDMFTQIGFTGDEAANMSKSVVQAAADLGSFSNLDTADVSERISAAFRGEYDSLQAVIPNISAARVEQEAMAATGKKNADELTAQEKAAAVLAIVHKDGARAMGDFERTSSGAANSQRIATAAMEDQQAKLGGLLLPAWSGFLSFLNTDVIPGFSKVVDGISAIGSILFGGDYTAKMREIFGASEDSDLVDFLFTTRDTFINLGKTIGDVVSGVTDWISKNSDTVRGFAIAFGIIAGAVAAYNIVMGVARVATELWTAAQIAFDVAANLNPIGLIITAVLGLVAAIVWVATQTTFFQDAWTNVTNVVGAAWQWLWDSVLNPVFTAIGAIFSWIYNTIIVPIVTGIMLYIGIWAAIITWLWETVISPVIGLIGQLFNWLWANVLSPIIGFIVAGIQVWGAIFNWLWANIISPVIGFIVAGIQAWGAIFNWLYVNIISPVFSAVGASFNWIWGTIISPTINLISGAINLVGSTVRDVFGKIGGFIGSAFQGALSVVRGPINGIIGLVNSAIRGINSLSVTIPSWVPIVGGQTWGLHLPTIPMLARGSASSPDTFIAGENGPELVVGRPGSRVYPANETRNMLGGGGGGGGVTIEKIEINEATDPLGSPGRIAAELRTWRSR